MGKVERALMAIFPLKSDYWNELEDIEDFIRKSISLFKADGSILKFITLKNEFRGTTECVLLPRNHFYEFQRAFSDGKLFLSIQYEKNQNVKQIVDKRIRMNGCSTELVKYFEAGKITDTTDNYYFEQKSQTQISLENLDTTEIFDLYEGTLYDDACLEKYLTQLRFKGNLKDDSKKRFEKIEKGMKINFSKEDLLKVLKVLTKSKSNEELYGSIQSTLKELGTEQTEEKEEE